MIVELRSRRNRSLPPPHRELLQVHERLAASVLFDAASVDAPKTALPQGWQSIAIADPSSTDDQRTGYSLACRF
jgi:hypothetical protein